MGRGHRYGLIIANIKEIGRKTRHADMGPFIIPMAISMKDSGKMTKLMGKALILTPMEPNILENGRMISNTDTELKNGSMERNTKVSMKMEQKLEKGL